MRCQHCGAPLTSTDCKCSYCGTVDLRYAPGLTATQMQTIRTVVPPRGRGTLPRPLPTTVPGSGSKVSR